MLTIKDIFDNVRDLDEKQQWSKDILRQTLYLNTEAGEFTKEVLKATAVQGEGLTEEQKIALGKEGFDVIWNVCAVLLRLSISEDEFAKHIFQKMNENSSRVFRPD